MRMKHSLGTLAVLVLNLGLVSLLEAVELLRWQRLPLSVPLVVGEERVVFVDSNVRVGVQAGVGDRLRVQSAGGAVYLKAGDALPPTRIQLQDVESGALILLDVTAEAARDGQPPREAVRIVVEETAGQRDDRPAGSAPGQPDAPASPPDTPIPVVLIRHAAQSLYAPLRTVEPVAGVRRANLARDLSLDTLLPTLPVRARSLTAWRLDGTWVTAVALTNVSASRLDLDPRALQGDFVAAAFQHPDLGPAGDATDTTVVYLVTRGHGLAESLLPALAPFNPQVNLPRPGGRHAR